MKAELEGMQKMFITVSQRHYVEKIAVQGTKKQDQSLAGKSHHEAYMSFLVMGLAQKSSKPSVMCT